MSKQHLHQTHAQGVVSLFLLALLAPCIASAFDPSARHVIALPRNPLCPSLCLGHPRDLRREHVVLPPTVVPRELRVLVAEPKQWPVSLSPAAGLGQPPQLNRWPLSATSRVHVELDTFGGRRAGHDLQGKHGTGEGAEQQWYIPADPDDSMQSWPC